MPAALPRVTPYRDYLAWLAGAGPRRRDRGLAGGVGRAGGGHACWRRLIAARVPVAPEQITLALSETLTAALTRQARAQGLTLNTFIQAAWAILLGRLTGRDDVVFGVTVAGRPPEIAGIERMVGLFINTLPLRVRLPPSKPLRALLQELQDSQSRLMAHQHLGLAEIQGLAGLGELFDTLVVFENYPVDRGSLAADAGGLRLTDVSGHDATHYPLSLMAVPGERLQLRLDYRPDLFERASVEAHGWRGWCGCWRRRSRSPSGRSAASTFSPPRSATPSCAEWNDTARAVAVRHLAGAVRRAGRRARPMRSRWCSRTEPQLCASSMRAPTSWRIICARSASAPRPWSGCASSARSRCWSGCSASSRPAAPICRSIPTTRASGWPSCWRMPARRCW